MGGWDGTGRGLGLGVGVWQGTAWRLPEESEREGVEIKAEREKNRRGEERNTPASHNLTVPSPHGHQYPSIGIGPQSIAPLQERNQGEKEREEMEERAATCYINKRKEMYESKRKERKEKSSMLTTASKMK